MRMVFTLLTLLLVANVALAEEDPVTFDDVNLEAAVRFYLEIPEGDIYPDDMLRLTQHLIWSGVEDLTGLEYATNLPDLRLYNGLIADLSPISELTSLTILDFSYNQISDITPISNLTNLDNLNLDSNLISDLPDLAGLPNLTGLDVRSNQISNFPDLSGLTSLTYLNLSYNQISLIPDLSYLPDLTNLALSHNQISNISPISDLTNLTSLALNNNQVSNIDPVLDLTNLTNLYLQSNQISDISPISGLTSLTLLYLSSNLLDCPAYGIYIPMIIDNNPGINITYDPMPEPCLIWMIDRIIAFVIESAENETLEGTGNSPDDRIEDLIEKLGKVRNFIVKETIDQACKHLSKILLKCDGISPPPDVVRDISNSGATEELADMIIVLMENLECE
jgi:hypothetical protein